MLYQKIFSGIALLLPITSLLFLGEVSVAETLITENYQVTINADNCPEYALMCDSVSYHGTNLNTGTTIKLIGSKVYRICADGVTPCQFMGYEFRQGNYRYYVHDVPDNTWLIVYREKELLLREEGTWKY